jgi:hypothetical protein
MKYPQKSGGESGKSQVFKEGAPQKRVREKKSADF